ncbi:unnamed protein product, partial [marine sediment metagenome]
GLTLSESDPFWFANYTAYNDSWSAGGSDDTWITNWTNYNLTWTSTENSTYDSYNTSGFIRDWFVDIVSVNATMKLYVDSVAGSDATWLTNWTNYNSTWSSTTNTSYYLESNPYSYYNSTNNQTEVDPQ